MSIAKFIATGAATAALVVVPSVADAATPTQPACASSGEYSRIDKGMTIKRVVNIIGSHGKVTFDYQATDLWWHDREWKRCGMARYHGVSVSFTDGRVTSKGKW